MKIYFGGDSYVAGSELTNPATQGFASKLATKLDAEFINQAEGGSSNSLILRKIEKFLLDLNYTKKPPPDLIVIGWTEVSREDWFLGTHGYKSVASTALDNPWHNSEAYEYWSKHMETSRPYWHQMSKFYNRAIHNLSLNLTWLNIPHVFFNAIAPLNVTEHIGDPQYLLDPILKLDWKDCFFHPYDSMTWRAWAIDHGYKEITPGKFHYEEAAHTEWANVIYDYIKEKKLV